MEASELIPFSDLQEDRKNAGPMEYLMFRASNQNGEQVIGRGIMKRQFSQQAITNYRGVDSLAEYSKKVEKLGGNVKVPKTEVPGFGWFAICTDTENNTFAIWEPNPDAQMNRQ